MPHRRRAYPLADNGAPRGRAGARHGEGAGGAGRCGGPHWISTPEMAPSSCPRGVRRGVCAQGEAAGASARAPGGGPPTGAPNTSIQGGRRARAPARGGVGLEDGAAGQAGRMAPRGDGAHAGGRFCGAPNSAPDAAQCWSRARARSRLRSAPRRSDASRRSSAALPAASTRPRRGLSPAPRGFSLPSPALLHCPPALPARGGYSSRRTRLARARGRTDAASRSAAGAAPLGGRRWSSCASAAGSGGRPRLPAAESAAQPLARSLPGRTRRISYTPPRLLREQGTFGGCTAEDLKRVPCHVPSGKVLHHLDVRWFVTGRGAPKVRERRLVARLVR